MAIPFPKYSWGELNPIDLPDSADRLNKDEEPMDTWQATQTKVFQSNVFHSHLVIESHRLLYLQTSSFLFRN